MNLNEVFEALPTFTFEERQLLMRGIIELDDPPLLEADEALVESRLADHHSNPTSSLSLDALREGLRSRTKQ